MITEATIRDFLNELEELRDSKEFLFLRKGRALYDFMQRLSSRLKPDVQSRLKNINIPFTSTIHSDTFNQIAAVLSDLLEGKKVSRNKEDMEVLKLLEARFQNMDFDLELAKMISGKNRNFPQKNQREVEYFFQELGFTYSMHCYESRATRADNEWISERLKENSILEIYRIIKDGIFKKKYFKFVKDIEKAKLAFKDFLENGTMKTVDLSDVFNLNVKNDLLFNKNTSSSDNTLNKLVNQAKQAFVEGDKQIALEKIWDAFERVKTLMEGDKKNSSSIIITLLSDEISSVFFEAEFRELTKIGNERQIRHFEKGVKEIRDEHIKEYLFFRALVLIDLVLVKVLMKKDTECFVI